MKNKELAKIFFEMADALELMNVQWKPNAYRKAARSIDTMSRSVDSIYSKDGIKGLKKIPGVGQGIAEKIEEFLKTGRIKEYQKLAKKIPKGVEEMMNVPGMGPKKALKLYKKLGIKSIKNLEHAAKKGRLQRLAGFGKKSEQDILENIGMKRKSAGRTLLGIALPIARDLVGQIRKIKGVKK
ncbi:DNA polymerase III, partial [Candidatus Woesearchaeota archaeon]|nr:DNA polymerase III [Candidatus Woesearchaeota archaeon]